MDMSWIYDDNIQYIYIYSSIMIIYIYTYVQNYDGLVDTLLVGSYKAMEHDPFVDYLPLQVVIPHSYVKLPKSISHS